MKWVGQWRDLCQRHKWVPWACYVVGTAFIVAGVLSGR